MGTKTQFVCPFCAGVIAEAPDGLVSMRDYKQTERDLRAHLFGRHPIRARLNRRVRRALRAYDAVERRRVEADAS